MLALASSSADVHAQFNARGRGRSPSATSPKPPASNATPKRKTQAGSHPSGNGEEKNQNDLREEALIARYRALIVQQPGEEVPLRRLAELTRKRDGSLKSLLAELEEELKTTNDKYAVLIALAGLLGEDGQLEESSQTLQRAGALAPARKEAWLALGRLKKKQGDQAGAKAAFEKAKPLVTGPERTILLRDLRDLCLELAEYDAASAYHASLVKESAGNMFLQGELGRELLSRGQTERAIAELSRVVTASAGDNRSLAPALRDLGAAEFEAGKLAKAIKTLERASKLSANEPGQRIAIDTLLAQVHRKNGSLPTYIAELENEARSAARLALLARLLEEEGQTEKALKAYQSALSRDSTNIDIRLTLVRLYELTGDLDNAVREYGKLVKSSPRDVQLSLRYMEMLLAQGERTAVLREWDRIEKLTRNDPDAGLLLIDVAERLEEVERAERILARLALKNGGDSRFLVELGSRFYRKGDEKAARRAWDRILTVEREPSQAHILLGEVLLDHEALKDGLEALEKAVALAPYDIKARRALALGLERAASQSSEATRRSYEQAALGHFLVLLEMPDSPGMGTAKSLAERHVIRLWRRNGSLALELSKLKKRLDATPPDLRAGRLLAEGLMAERRWPEAISALQKILAVNQGDRQALLLLESAYEKSGQSALAITTLKRLVETDPNRARDYYERMAQSANRQGDAEQALSYAELAVAKNPNDPAAQAQLGDLYLAQGKTEQAKSAFRSALKQDDRLHLVALKLAELLGQSGQLHQSLELLVHVVRTSPDHEVVSRAARRALSISIPVDKTRELEDVLRPLAIGRSEQPLYRMLLLEILAAEMSPFLQRAQYGSAEDSREAQRSLTALADRSTQPLLAALSNSFGQEQQTAIQLLAYSSVSAAAGALLAFAESGAKEEQRLLAVLATGRVPRAGVADRMSKILLQEDNLARGRLAQAATWSLGRQADPKSVPLLLRCLREGEPEVRVYAALALAGIPKLAAKTSQRVNDALLKTLEDPSKGDASRSAAALALSQLDSDLTVVANSNRERYVDLLLMLSETGSPLLIQSSLRALSGFTANGATKRAIARALNSERSEVRQTAAVAAARLIAEERAGHSESTKAPSG